MKKSTVITALVAILAMAVTPTFAQEENGFKKFNVRENFTVMAFDVEQSKVLNYMGTKSGRDGDKAQALGLHTAYTANGYANFSAGIHSMYIGEVINAWKK